MAKKVPDEVVRLGSVPTLGVGETSDEFGTVKAFLARFGYLGDELLDETAPGGPTFTGPAPELLDEETSVALARYQAMHGLPESGVFDAPTKAMMSRRRCGVPDLIAGVEPSFSAGCAWTRDLLSYAFEGGTADVGGDAERDAVRRAFATWSANVQIAFREVAITDSPDVRIGWRQALCGDTSMVGTVLAHADYPPGCGFFGNALPRPLHFDDQETAWCIGAVAGQFDIETVALHEIGHILGLYHSNIAAAVMFASAAPNATKRALAPDDLEGIRNLYPLRGPVFVRHSGKCLDIQHISRDDGADATQWEYVGGQNQLFRVEWVEARHYRLVAQHSGKVIDVEGLSRNNGAQVHQWGWWGGDNQKFRLDPLGDGYYRVVAKHSNKCLDVAAISPSNSAKVTQWDWWGGGNQQWRLGPAAITARHSGKALDVEALGFGNGARVIQWPFWGGGNQKLRLDPVGEGYYRIIVEHSGKCLDVSGISQANGAPIIQWEYWGGDNQRFRPESTGDGHYRLVAKHSGKCLDVSGISRADGAAIIQWEWWGGQNQQWRL